MDILVDPTAEITLFANAYQSGFQKMGEAIFMALGDMMPTISMFYGIIISMFFEIREKHHLPHIHVRYQGYRASIAIGDGVLLAGELPPKQLRMVQVWADLHREELMADWELAKDGVEPFRIDPLR